MSLLGDLLLDVFANGLGRGPSANRGVLLSLSVPALVLVGIAGWLILASPDPVNEPPWGWGVLAGSIVTGSVGTFLSVLHMVREPAERILAALCLTTNVAAVAIPLIWLAGRV